MVRRLGVCALLALPALLCVSTEGMAIQCGPATTCELAGTVNNSPFSVGSFGDFATSVDAVNDASVGRPPENAGDSYSHAWQFSLAERAHIAGTLTKNNTLANFQQDPVFLELFSLADLENNIGETFAVPLDGQSNPFVAFRYANLATGDYLFKVAGTLIGNDGQYAGQLGVSEVPLPPAVWLFVTAVLGLATVARKKNAAASA
jgi:hypothetical protein